MKVKFKKITKKAKVPFKKYDEDFCFDLYATSCEEVATNVWKYGLGLAFEIDKEGFDFHLEKMKAVNPHLKMGTQEKLIFDLDFRSRSSVWKTGMILSNCTGTIDELYRGEVSAVFYHVMPNMPKYEVGNRIIQCKIGITIPIQWEEVDELSETERGANGYGHTGR